MTLGFASTKVKNDFVHHLASHIPAKWFEEHPECSKMEIVSCFAQPFFISPMINVSDILVAVYNVAAMSPKAAVDGEAMSAKQLVKTAMLRYPAFPILEREISPNKQVILLLSPTSNEKMGSALLFGSGPRKCPGKDVALTLLHHIVDRAGRNKWKNFTPAVGHLYSGRNNDDDVKVDELLFVLRVLLRTLGLAALEFVGIRLQEDESVAIFDAPVVPVATAQPVKVKAEPRNLSVNLLGNETDSGAESASDSEAEED